MGTLIDPYKLSSIVMLMGNLIGKTLVKFLVNSLGMFLAPPPCHLFSIKYGWLLDSYLDATCGKVLRTLLGRVIIGFTRIALLANWI